MSWIFVMTFGDRHPEKSHRGAGGWRPAGSDTQSYCLKTAMCTTEPLTSGMHCDIVTTAAHCLVPWAFSCAGTALAPGKQFLKSANSIWAQWPPLRWAETGVGLSTRGSKQKKSNEKKKTLFYKSSWADLSLKKMRTWRTARNNGRALVTLKWQSSKQKWLTDRDREGQSWRQNKKDLLMKNWFKKQKWKNKVRGGW